MTDDDLDDLAAPNCPRDLVPMEVDGSDDRPVWLCPLRGLQRLF